MLSINKWVLADTQITATETATAIATATAAAAMTEVVVVGLYNELLQGQFLEGMQLPSSAALLLVSPLFEP